MMHCISRRVFAFTLANLAFPMLFFGMDQFDKEGTSKLKSTVEDEFGDVLDRLKALTSDDCTYNTFSGKDSNPRRLRRGSHPRCADVSV